MERYQRTAFLTNLRGDSKERRTGEAHRPFENPVGHDRRSRSEDHGDTHGGAAANDCRGGCGSRGRSGQIRTKLDFAASYGTVKQPDTPLVKTEIYHANAERDEYFSASVFAFAQAAFDHNFSQ